MEEGQGKRKEAVGRVRAKCVLDFFFEITLVPQITLMDKGVLQKLKETPAMCELTAAQNVLFILGRISDSAHE